MIMGIKSSSALGLESLETMQWAPYFMEFYGNYLTRAV
jgi:hypothetical protein